MNHKFRGREGRKEGTEIGREFQVGEKEMKRKGEEESRKREKVKREKMEGKMEQERRRFGDWVKGVIKERGR